MKNVNRRSFFKTITFGAAGLTILNSFPLNIFAGNNKVKGKIKVKIHPSAVKRTK